MSTWLKLLPIELDSIQNIMEPDQDLNETDKIVGQMPEFTRKLFTLARLLEKDANQSILDSRYCRDKERKLELQAKADEYGDKSRIVHELMWIGIRDELRLWGKSIGIRTGFTVVVLPDDDADNTFFKRLLGGR